MNRSLNALDSIFRPIVFEFLARLIEAGIPVMIVNTLRTQAEQDAAVARGASWRAHSLHQDGLAIDVCPYVIWSEFGDDKLQWDADDPQWAKIGAIGESLGLRWGGCWTHRDMGHIEYKDPRERPPGGWAA